MSVFSERARRAVEARKRNAGRWVWIYALVDPTTLQPRYVGQSRSVFQRLDYHCGGCASKALSEWRATWRARPMLLLLQRVKPSLAVAAEEWWIDEGLRRGWALVNVARARPERRLA